MNNTPDPSRQQNLPGITIRTAPLSIMKTSLIALAAIFLLSGCATVSNPVPADYKGPVVRLDDSGDWEDESKARFFAALEINGSSIQNATRESRMASQGQGFSLTTRYTSRLVPVRAMKVRIIGTHQTAAPIQEFAGRMAGTFFKVEGVVDFNPAEGKHYIVTGELKKEQSCVWIADAESNAVVTDKVCTK